jgi:hypothetical protein
MAGLAAGCAEAPPTSPTTPIAATANTDATRFFSTEFLPNGGLDAQGYVSQSAQINTEN